MIGMPRSHGINLNIREIIVWCSLFSHQDASYPPHSKNTDYRTLKTTIWCFTWAWCKWYRIRGRNCIVFGWERGNFLHSSPCGACFGNTALYQLLLRSASTAPWPLPPQWGVHKRLGEDTAGTADLKYQRDSMLYNVILSNETEGQVSSKVFVAQRLTRHQFPGGAFTSQCSFTFSFIIKLFLTQPWSLGVFFLVFLLFWSSPPAHHLIHSGTTQCTK